jgi:hypothetical protein
LDSLSVAGESYSAWFLRFLAAFNGPARRRDAPGASHEEWLAAFVEAFRHKRATSEEVLDWSEFDVGEREGHAESEGTSYRPAETRQAEEKRRFMQSGGEDVER